MNDPFASFDPLGKQKQAATAHSYATMPTPMPLAAPAAGPFNQFGGMPPQAPYGHHPHHQGMQQSNPFGMGMPMGGPPLQTMAAQQPPKMFPNNSGAAFMTQPGGPAFGGLGMMPQQQQQYMTNPFGAAPPPPPQQQVQGNTNPFGAEPIVYDSIKNLLHPKPADPFATAPSGPVARPAPLKTQTSTIADFDPFSPRADTPRMPQTVANGYDASTADRTGSGGASALADRQNRARQTQDAARTELGFDTNAFQHANATPKVSLKHMAPSSEPNRTASIRTAAPSLPYDDSPFFSDSNDAFAGQTVSNLDDDFAPSGDNRTNSWGHEARGSSNGSEDAVAETCGPNEYEVTFESGRKLGVLMERVDVWSGKRDDRRFEVAVVKLVVENGAADRVGVTIGSSVLAINNRSVAKDSYMVVLDLIKTAPRPMTIRFQRGAVNKDTTQGNVLSRISNGTFSVGNLTSGNASWTPKYFAYGGAKLDVLQLFVSRAAYHECVISLYEKRAVHTQIQSFRLCRDHKISPIKSKIYKGYGNLHYFSLTVPSLRFVAAKFASEDYETIKNMWSLAYEAIERKKRMGY